jgi:hypothetical protein
METSQRPIRAGAGAQRAKAARSGQVRAKRQRWYALAMSFCMLIAVVWLAVGTDVPQRVYALATSHEASDADTDGARTGKIIVQTDLDHCRQGTFDNNNGRIVSNDGPCEGDIVLDAHGMPVPTGTIHRLNSISKSFSGN